jgi:hypothetical protein
MKKIRVFLAIVTLLLAFGTALAFKTVNTYGYVFTPTACELVMTPTDCNRGLMIPCTIIDPESDFFGEFIRESPSIILPNACGFQLWRGPGH